MNFLPRHQLRFLPRRGSMHLLSHFPSTLPSNQALLLIRTRYTPVNQRSPPCLTLPSRIQPPVHPCLQVPSRSHPTSGLPLTLAPQTIDSSYGTRYQTSASFQVLRRYLFSTFNPMLALPHAQGTGFAHRLANAPAPQVSMGLPASLARSVSLVQIASLVRPIAKPATKASPAPVSALSLP